METFFAVVTYNGERRVLQLTVLSSFSASSVVVKIFRCYASCSISHCVVLVPNFTFDLAFVKHLGVSTFTLYVSMHLAGFMPTFVCLYITSPFCVISSVSIYYTNFRCIIRHFYVIFGFPFSNSNFRIL